MPWHAIESPVQPEPLPHPGHRAAEDFHIAARVVAADALGIDPPLQSDHYKVTDKK